MRIHIVNPNLVASLVDALVAAECRAEVLDPHTCVVAYPAAVDKREALTELRFFLRAWQRKHGAGAVLLAEG